MEWSPDKSTQNPPVSWEFYISRKSANLDWEERDKKNMRRLLSPQTFTNGKQREKLISCKHVPSFMKTEAHLLGVQNQEPRGLNTEQRQEGGMRRDRKTLPNPGNFNRVFLAEFQKGSEQVLPFSLHFRSVLNSNVYCYLMLVSPFYVGSVVSRSFVSLASQACRLWKVVMGHLICTWFLLLSWWALGPVSWWNLDETWEFWVGRIRMKF